MHDFVASFELAKRDEDLKYQLIKNLLTDKLLLPSTSTLASSTADIITWVIQDARSRYASNPERLVAAISASTEANALAVWSSSRNDWIVLSYGLMERLQSGADNLGDRIAAAFPEVMHSELMQRLLQKNSLPGFRTTLGSFIYFGAIAFFAGHEAGHHLSGHDGHFVKGAHAEHSNTSDMLENSAWLRAQALEQDADLIGLDLARRGMTKLLMQLCEVGSFSPAQQQSYQRVLAVLIAVGAMAAVLRVVPREIEWEGVPRLRHPPSVVRVLTLAASLSASFKESFGQLDATSRKWIRLMSLEIAASATILPGTPVDKIYQERLKRGGEPAAIRATGIRKALNDPQFRDYLGRLATELQFVRPKLKPRT
ncbi:MULTISPECIES: hypothetical protein [unclassified Variovorax]|uniref:hypothetical protein n=1 Tax=unclassified Variovorax TaxID=663243 RepID=UPI0034E98507